MRINKKKSAEKQYEELKKFHQQLASTTPLPINETPQAKARRIAALEADPEEWFKYYFPEYAKYPAADFHKSGTARVLNNPEFYEVRCWSRELAKSTRTMMEIMYLALTKRKHNVLVISNSEDNAKRLLLPYKVNFETNPRILNDYGPQQTLGQWDSGEFAARCGCAFRAVGAGQSPRGTRSGAIRPDVICSDDLDTDEDCRNPEQIKKHWDWLQEAVMGTRSMSEPLLMIWCGNIIAKDCCVVRATKYADHVDIINMETKLEDGTLVSSWPQKNTMEMIERVKKTVSTLAWQKEYCNNPISEGSVFKQVNWKPIEDIRDYKMLVCYTDPSYKDSEKNDYKATVLVGQWRDEFHVIKALVFQGTIAQMVQNHYEIMDIVGTNACYYYMEEVFMQDLFYDEFTIQGAQRGRIVPISGDTRPKPDKFSRIDTTLEPLNRNGKLYFNEAEKNHPGMQALEEQFIGFGPGTRMHDDGPDAVEGAVWMINNKTAVAAAGSIQFYQRPNFSNNSI